MLIDVYTRVPFMVATTAQHGAIAYIKLILRIQVLHAKYFFSRLILVSQLLTASTICAFLTLECIQGSVPPPGLSRISKQIIKYLNDSTKETQRKRAKKNSNYAEFPYSFCVQHISRHCQASQTVTDLEGTKNTSIGLTVCHILSGIQCLCLTKIVCTYLAG